MITSTSKIFCMGRSGCGKSYLGRRIQNLFPRRVIFDTVDEYGPEDGEIVTHFEEFCDRILKVSSENEKTFVIIYQFDPESRVTLHEFDHILRICFSLGNLQIVIEEVQDFANVHSLPHWLKQCLLKGRHRNLSMLFTSQRPGEVHKTILSQCTHIFCGTIVDGNDLRYLTPIFTSHTEKLPSLPDRRFLFFSRDGITEISNDF